MTTKVQLAGRRPDTDNWFTEPVVAGWYDRYVAEGNTEKPHAIADTRMRASWAGDCARALAYHFAGLEESDPPTVADCWRFNIGTLLHEHVQRTIIEAFPGSEAEVKVLLTDTDGSAHMDLQVVRRVPWADRPWRSAVEVKTINGTGFRRFISLRNPEGPRYKYVMQAALAASSQDPLPDDLVVAVFSLECLSPKETRVQGVTDEYQRFAAQWTFSQEEFLAIAAREKARINRAIELVDARENGWEDVPRKQPDPTMPNHVMTDPSTGTYRLVDDRGQVYGSPGHTWQCEYCPFLSMCDDFAKQGR